MLTSSPHQRNIQPVLAEFGIQAPNIVLNELVLDSREVAIHSGFVALKGHARDGRDFIPQAVSLGAKVILSETENDDHHGQISMREQSLIIDFYRLPQQLSALASSFYQQPSGELQTVAVTGTNGKTSTVQLCSQLVALMGGKAGSIGTLGVQVHHNNAESAVSSALNTTPDAISMQRIMRQMCEQRLTFCGFEASSHALVQGRISAVNIDVAVFTNLSRDHLDYHGNMFEYARAKRLLLNQPRLGYVVLNADDDESQNWLANKTNQVQAVLISTQGKPDAYDGLYCCASEIEYLPSGSRFRLLSSWGEGTLTIGLIGAFNISNLLCAIAAQLALGSHFDALLKAAHQVRPIAGRMEVFSCKNQANALVDFAHTPDALQHALESARRHCKGKLWCIFGCGGDRDQGKRPLMGEIAERYADVAVITNDNSRNEDPTTIAEQILTGFASPEKVHIELDRQVAIQYALEKAAVEDLILVAGKGHENYQLIGDQRIEYDERNYVKQLYVEVRS